jgi:membrane associated rhomboid family serine protease
VRSMLSDRSYMREEYQRERTSALTWLVSAMAAGFILQLVMASTLVRGGGRFEDLFALSPAALQNGWGWTLLTHPLLHSTEFPFHAVFVILPLYFLGRELMPMLGTRRFMGLFAAATIVSGLVWSGLHWGAGDDTLVGATAAVEALFIVFACFFPNQEISFLLFFFPVTFKPKHVAFALTGFALLGLFCYELPDNELPFGAVIASSAHLGGILTGYFYYRFVHDGRWFASPDRAEVELPRWLKRTRHALPAARKNAEPPAPVAAPAPDIRAEVDRILDKINSEGLGALTDAERRILDNAKHLLSRP